MNIWFIVYLALEAMAVGMHLAKHGEARTGEYNFWVALIGAIISIVIVSMAVKGGF